MHVWVVRWLSRVVGPVIVAVLASGSPVFAQDQLLVGGRFIGAIGHYGAVLGPGPQVAADDIFGGGRFAVRRAGAGPYGGSDVIVVDTRTGVSTPVAGWFLAADRARPVVFVSRSGDTLASLDVWAVSAVTGEERRLLRTGPGSLYPECAHAFSANVLFCASHRSDGRADIVAIDVAAGTHRVAAVAPLTTGVLGHRAWRPLATPDGRRLYFDYLLSTPQDPLPMRFDFAALDVDTGQLARHAPLDGPPSWDDANERLMTVSGTIDNSGAWVSIYTKDVVPIVHRAVLPVVPVLHTSPHTGRLYVVGQSAALNGPVRERLWVFDSTTFASLAPPVDRLRDEIRGVPNSYAVALLTAPGCPRDVVSTVTGYSVSVSWSNVGGASHFVLEAGLAPGRTDLSVFLGPDPRATFANVPPGTYYLRVRGGNEFGGGRPSPELRVVVP